VFIPDEVLKL